jgi:hypothetical protein
MREKISPHPRKQEKSDCVETKSRPKKRMRQDPSSTEAKSLNPDDIVVIEGDCLEQLRLQPEKSLPMLHNESSLLGDAWLWRGWTDRRRDGHRSLHRKKSWRFSGKCAAFFAPTVRCG